MFSFFRKKKFNYSFDGFVDRHTHLLCGVDDGAQTLEESQLIVDQMNRFRFKEAWCTPHIKPHYRHNSPFLLRERFAEMTSKLSLGGLTLHLAAEYMLDSTLLDRIEMQGALTYEDKCILIEFPSIGMPQGWHDVLFQLKIEGYTPVIAHPERYGRFLPVEELVELHSEGCELQLNVPSLFGQYGKTTQKRALELQSMDLYLFRGSDVHTASLFDFYSAK